MPIIFSRALADGTEFERETLSIEGRLTQPDTGRFKAPHKTTTLRDEKSQAGRSRQKTAEDGRRRQKTAYFGGLVQAFQGEDGRSREAVTDRVERSVEIGANKNVIIFKKNLEICNLIHNFAKN